MRQLINFKPPRLGALNYEFTDSKFVTAFDSENIYYKNIKLNKNTKLSNLSNLEIFRQNNPTNNLPYGSMFPSTLPCNYTVRSNFDAENSARSLTSNKAYTPSCTINRSYTNTLDKTIRDTNSGTVFSFKDTSNVDHLIYISFQEASVTTTYTFDVKIMLLEASQLDNIAASAVRTYTNTAHPLNTTYISTALPSVIWVDTTRKFIYLNMSAGYIGSNVSFDSYKTTSLYRVSYTTRAVDGTITLGAYEYINIPTPTNYLISYLSSDNLYYCGLSNDGNPIYIRFCEKDAATTVTTWYLAPPETHFHRFIIAQHNLTTNVVTVLYDLDSRNSWGAGPNINTSLNRVTGFSSPTAFTQTASGSDLYVSYSAGFDTTNNLRIVAFFWNKATNVFQIKLLPLSNQATIKNEYQDTFDDSVPYVYSNSNTSLSLATKSICPVTLELIKATSGDYYLSIFNEFKSNRLLAFCPTAATRNIVTYAISNNWETLTHVQTATLNAIMAFFPDPDRNNLFVAESTSLSRWQFNPTTYWQKLSNTPNIYPYFFSKKTNDSIYVVDMASDEFQLLTTNELPERKFIDLKVYETSISSVASNTINMLTDQTVVYSGSQVASTLQVEARNSAGARIATSIIVDINSSNCTFSDTTTSKTVTTLTEDYLDLGILLNAPGVVYITARFDI